MARRSDGMYQRGRICIMLASLCALLAVAVLASAECAWVLWEKQSADTGRSFLLDWAFPSRDECEAARTGWRSKAAAQENAAKGAGLKPDDGIRISFQCIPDTVDPRGPKGGQR